MDGEVEHLVRYPPQRLPHHLDAGPGPPRLLAEVTLPGPGPGLAGKETQQVPGDPRQRQSGRLSTDIEASNLSAGKIQPAAGGMW